MVPDGADLVLALEENAAPGTALIGATPGHPVIAAALGCLVATINRGDNDGGWLMTGPGLLARLLAEAMAERGWPLAGRHVLELDELGRPVATQCHAPRETVGWRVSRKRLPSRPQPA